MAVSYKRGNPVGECIPQFQGSRENLGATISSKTACATADFLLGGSASAVGVEATLHQGSVRGTPAPRHSQGLQGYLTAFAGVPRAHVHSRTLGIVLQ